MKWNDLNMTEKAALMQLFLKNGISSIDTMKNMYEEGGYKDRSTEVKKDRYLDEVLNNPLYKKDREEKIYNYLIDSGLDDIHASAMMGNLAVESHLDASMQQHNGPAQGLGQWENPRLDKVRNYPYVYKFGTGLYPEEQQQLDYIIKEGIEKHTSGEWRHGRGFNEANRARKVFNESDDLSKTTDILLYNYFRPSKLHRKRRHSAAEYFYKKYRKSTGPFSSYEFEGQFETPSVLQNE